MTSQPNFAFLDCLGVDPLLGSPVCGTVGLTEEQYRHQIRLPDKGWRCLKCGGGAEYNDVLSEKAQLAYAVEELTAIAFPPTWTRAEALLLCIEIENLAPQFGCHVGLTGGLLYKPGARKDCDLLFYRIRQAPKIDLEGLFGALADIGLVHEYGTHERWCIKARYEGKRVDCFFPEFYGEHSSG